MMHGTQPSSVPALRIDELSHSYGQRRALEAVTFATAPGTFTVLLGLNGAGKSTLFALVTRLYATQRGRVEIFGHDIGRHPGEALRRLGVVFQSRTLDLDLSVIQNMVYHGALHGIGAREAKARAKPSLDRIGLADRAADKVRNLSGGQMRRVEIARALLHRPHLLVLDEPTVGLDIRARADMLAEVRHLVADEGVCVLWATHLVDEVDPTDNVVVLHRGRVLADGAVSHILAETGEPDIRSAFIKLTRAPDQIAGEVS
jgi:ABC-2 type transport system ATP-binding protein